MSIMTWTRHAKCKDCNFLQRYNKGKLVRHYCANRLSEQFSKDRKLNDLVCDSWKL